MTGAVAGQGGLAAAAPVGTLTLLPTPGSEHCPAAITPHGICTREEVLLFMVTAGHLAH